MAILTNYYKSGDFKKEKCILSQFWRSEVRNWGVCRATVFPQTPTRHLILACGSITPLRLCGWSCCLLFSYSSPTSLTRTNVTGFRAQLDNLGWSFGLKSLNYICKDPFPKWGHIHRSRNQDVTYWGEGGGEGPINLQFYLNHSGLTGSVTLWVLLWSSAAPSSSCFPAPNLESAISPRSPASLQCRTLFSSQSLSSSLALCCRGVMASRPFFQWMEPGNVHNFSNPVFMLIPPILLLMGFFLIFPHSVLLFPFFPHNENLICSISKNSFALNYLTDRTLLELLHQYHYQQQT